MISTVGSWVLALGLLVTAAYLLYALVRGKPAGSNPWRSRSFEWRTASPPPTHNFEREPSFEVGAYDYTQPLPERES